MLATLPNRLPQVAGIALVLALGLRSLAEAESPTSNLAISPAKIILHGQGARQRLIVSDRQDGGPVDVTREVEFRSLTPDIVALESGGWAVAVGNGAGKIEAVLDRQAVQANVKVTGAEQSPAVGFERDVLPVLTACGCSTGACHGKQRGQNGFQLSLLCFDPNFDYEALVHNARGRRVFPAAAELSLLLKKGSGQVPHGGGQRLAPGGRDYEILRRWIAAGVPRGDGGETALERISIEPTDGRLRPGEQQQTIVTAYYSDGSWRDVTDHAMFASSESALVAVDADGLVTAGPIPGQATIMARYMGHLATMPAIIPLVEPVSEEVYAALPRRNFIDDLVWQKLRLLNIVPSEPAPEATFLRRAYIDILGRLPTADEVRAYLAEADPNRRDRLVDRLLERPEYADYWATKWADLLRPNAYRVGSKTVMIFDQWIRDSFRQNKPYDQFVRELVAAQGSTWQNGAATLFRDRRSPDELTTMVSPLFLGIRLECAKCHHHPFERWDQKDFYSLSAYFARVGRKGGGIGPPISGNAEMIFTAKPTPANTTVPHPATAEPLPAAPLFGQAPGLENPETDPREVLVDWMLADGREYFSQVMANRVWADLMGRGLVDPVDDLRVTNPATNEPLLKALAKDFRQQGYDVKKLIRTIVTSHVYGLSSLPGERNVADTQNHSRYYRQRLRAEVLLDAVRDITGVADNFAAMPPDSRSMQLWTTRVGSLFLDTFGRPDPNQDPPCERTSDTAVTQALHLMNSPDLHRKILSDTGRAAELAAGRLTPEQLIEELYLSIYSRYPTPREREIGLAHFAKPGMTRRMATEDMMWALLNTPEFVFKN